ncbi:hypothetical protein [Methylobacterium brachythecii]|uniref:Uncharacterized protein n=1 Tax=Methylobacterium brachythecii TaxID=1176177 RepID=A0A7W6ASB0_9HYPH|nr:hypothetical protein [Methylobacterium brachythecii]MBB3905701.1 hypothetical protein [Methylobacterium brachythecii]GLS47035.1 hypothetical protein GCM10007884_50360 [Methylobacterium brachythecii]
MDPKLSEAIQQAAVHARRCAKTYKSGVNKDALPWRVIEVFDERVRGAVERDRRIEDERDRVLIAAVTLAEAPAEEEASVGMAREHLIDAIDFLEQAALRFGIPNGRRQSQ